VIERHETERSRGTVKATSVRASAGRDSRFTFQADPDNVAIRGRENPGSFPQ
jgi:hypothetical protein